MRDAKESAKLNSLAESLKKDAAGMHDQNDAGQACWRTY